MENSPRHDQRIGRRTVDYCRVETFLARRRPPGREPRHLARGLRPSSVMTQARNAISRNYSDLTGRLHPAAGQKARIGWQALPGAAASEASACR